MLLFQNGIRLNVKRTDFKKDEIRFKISFGNGMLAIPSDKPEYFVALYALTAGGTKFQSAAEISAALYNMKASLGASISGNSFEIFGVSTRKIPVYCVERGAEEEKVVALTFDAAWGADKTQGIMDILGEYGAGGTFFLVGFWLDKYPEMTKSIAEAGFEIGNHSANHLNMPKLNAETMRTEITSVNAKIEELTGKKPVYFRAPYGDYSDKLMTAVEDLGMVGVQWSIDSLDWKVLSAKEITDRIVPNVKSGDIILFHNNSDHVLDALPLVLMALKNKGYSFVGLSDLVATENFTVDHTGMQHKNA